MGTSTHTSYYDSFVLPFLDAAATDPDAFFPGGLPRVGDLGGAYKMKGGAICTLTRELDRANLILDEWRKMPICADRALVDTHATPFLYGKKPDLAVVCCETAPLDKDGNMTASSFCLLAPIEWKLEFSPSQDGEGQVVEYANLTNAAQPYREFTVCVWHNGYNVKFYRVYRSWRRDDGTYKTRVQYTAVLPVLGQGIGARLIARLLVAPMEDLGVVRTLVTVNGQSCRVGRVVGCGSTATVFELVDELSGVSVGAVFKLVRWGNAEREIEVLRV